MRRKLRRLGVGDADADGTELGEVSTAANPYLFLAKHGMAVAGAGTGAARKLQPATTADSNGASTANATSAVADIGDSEQRSKSLVELVYNFLTCDRCAIARGVVTHAPTTVAGVNRLAAPFCLSVCLSVRTITQKRKIPKRSNLVQRMTLGYPTSGMILELKGQRSRSQSHKVQKAIEWPVYELCIFIECPASSCPVMLILCSLNGLEGCLGIGLKAKIMALELEIGI